MHRFLEKLKSTDKIKLTKSAFLEIIGFILSPFSWWNDLLINVPLAYLLTWPIAKLVHLFLPVSFELYLGIFIFNYWVTNLAGLLMMHYGVLCLRGKKLSKKEMAISFGVALIYTIIIAVVASRTDLKNILIANHIFPSWLD
ncbi:MAG: hypothetical protein ACOZBH_00385 [Patescibacteria group bacterium]